MLFIMDGNSELKSLKRMPPGFKNAWNFRWKSLQFNLRKTIDTTGIPGDVLQCIRYLSDVVQRVIFVAGLVAQLINHGCQPVHPVVLVLLRVASLLRILLLILLAIGNITYLFESLFQGH